MVQNINEASHLQRVAWLFPSLHLGNYWHPVLKEFAQVYPKSKVYTGIWPGYAPGYEAAFAVEVIGKMRFIDTTQQKASYGRGFIYVSPGIIQPLLHDKPNVIFVSGFSLWTLLLLLFKPIGHWRVVVMYDGSSPTVDYLDSPIRLALRKLMIHGIDGFITNSMAGKTYLTKSLKASPERVFAKPYQVPDSRALLQRAEQATIDDLPLRSPVFLFVGQLIPRKGIQALLEACQRLKAEGATCFTLLVIGEGNQQESLQEYCKANDLDAYVHWLGRVDYGELGAYFRRSDVFILPTLEDVWGMVVLEAMALGKPILCSKQAGASELVVNGKNGYLIDPQDPKAIAEGMRYFIEHPERIREMGNSSQDLIAEHTPEAAAQFLAEVTDVFA
jgi:glycosyltransferase involved in cell wall biosynthesis